MHQWHIGSCAKSTTAALYARLVDRGHAEWDARLSDLLPDLAGPIHAGWSQVTIDDLFLCRSGLPANLEPAELGAAYADGDPASSQRTRVAAAALSSPPERPGRFVYSNLGYIVAGAVIERIAAMSFEDALLVHLLAPLDITSGGFGPPPDV